MRLRFMPRVNRVPRPGTFAGAVALIVAVALLAAAPAWAQPSPYNSMSVLWVAPGDDGDVGQVSSYELRYSTSPVGADTTAWWSSVPSAQRLTLGPPLAPAGQDDSTRVTGLTPGTTYYFVLRAWDDYFNVSGYSNVASGTTLSCNPPTATPTLAAAASNGDVSVTLGGAGDPQAVSIHLYRAPGTTGGTWTQIQNLPPSATSYLDTAPSPGSTYRYRAAYMGALCEGPMSSVATVSLPGVAPPPAASTNLSTIHAYPNPSSGPLRIVLDVEATASLHAYIRLFDMNGHWVATPINGSYPPGTTEVTWNRTGRDGRTVGPGYYELLGTVGLARVRERIVLTP